MNSRNPHTSGKQFPASSHEYSFERGDDAIPPRLVTRIIHKIMKNIILCQTQPKYNHARKHATRIKFTLDGQKATPTPSHPKMRSPSPSAIKTCTKLRGHDIIVSPHWTLTRTFQNVTTSTFPIRPLLHRFVQRVLLFLYIYRKLFLFRNSSLNMPWCSY